MIPLAIPDLTGNEARYLQACIDSTFVSSVGPFVERFEAMIAAACGAPFGVAVASGTAGLHAALVALGVTRDDLVIVPSLTFIASANAVAYCGADPWLMDVERESWNLDPALLARTLAADTVLDGKKVIHRQTGRRVAAIMPVHVLGTPADMDPITGIAQAYGLPVVADAAAALGAFYRGRPVGRLGADLTVFSFNGNKTVTAGGGGAVVGEDEEKTALVRHLTTTARNGPGYDHDRVGFNYRMTNLQAAVGCAQLERLENLVAAKRRIRAVYDAALAALPILEPFPNPSWAQSACWFSGGLAKGLEPVQVDRLRSGLEAAGIAAPSFWKPLHRQSPYRSAPQTVQTQSEWLWPRILTLPCSSALSDGDQEKSLTALKQGLAAL